VVVVSKTLTRTIPVVFALFIIRHLKQAAPEIGSGWATTSRGRSMIYSSRLIGAAS
jgi:hypothetical protein